ncbi:MAG: uroporphyrinogen decarboxylase [Gammaproteobacteria bacterium]
MSGALAGGRLQNDRLIRALRREPVDRTPVWMMRQAGRYLPEYRATRARAGDFLTLCRTPELACEVTLQPIERFPLDAAILFSDILTVPDAMGLRLYFADSEGPRFERPVRDAGAIRNLAVPDPEESLRYVVDAVRLVRRELDGRVPLIGFAGSPWTVATYMVEGAASRHFAHIKALMYDAPADMHRLLDTVTRATAAYVNAQIAAGAQVMMLFDTWGGVLAPRAYRDFSLQYMQRIVAELAADPEGNPVPSILFTKGGGAWLEDMADTGCHALGIDWTVGLDEARRRVGHRVALQGNLDPTVLHAAPEVIRAEVARALESFGYGSGHVFNLGHGIHPDVDPAHAAVMIEAVQELSPPYHA